MTEEPETEDAREAWRRALGRAAAFVQARGSRLACLRARALVGEASGPEVRAFLIGEGGLASEDPESLRSAFEILDPLGQLAGPDVERAVASLGRTIGADGSWGDPREPLETRIFRTGMLGGFLAKSLMLRPALRSAVDGFLCRTWDAERVKTGAWEPVAAYAHWFSLNDSELADAALQWCGRELERGFRTRRFDAVTVSRVFVLCEALALPGASFSAPELCEAVANEQTEEGGFPLCRRALAGEPVAAALDAMTALVRLGRVRGVPSAAG